MPLLCSVGLLMVRIEFVVQYVVPWSPQMFELTVAYVVAFELVVEVLE